MSAKRMSRPDLVRKLGEMWGAVYTQTPYLKSVAIGGGEPLRGIKDSKLEFDFPVKIFCGSNGTGKTTFLALSVLAFHDNQALTTYEARKGYYDFAYFFGYSEREKHQKGIKISWEYTNNTSDSFSKGSERWIRYIKNDGTPRRPERGAEFVGLSRIVPAFEKRGFQRLFSNLKRHKPKAEQQELKKYLAEIMKKPYAAVISYEKKDATGAYRLTDYATHTTFNAGAGEECLTYILDTLLAAKDGSIVAIEEIEIGLHPATMERLIDVILEIARKKKLQIIITTHSPEFLRAAPKECIVLAERVNQKVNFTFKPHVENAVQCLSGKANKELYVVCEDEWAAEFVGLSLTKKQRDIVHISEYGSKDELIKKAETIGQVTSKPVLIVWDGDVKDSYLKNSQIDNQKLFAIKLPGSGAPEKFIKDLILNDELKSSMLLKYGLEDGDWTVLKSSLATITDDHDLFYFLSENLSVDNVPSVGKSVCQMAYEKKNADFLNIRDKVQRIIFPEEDKKCA